jgi:hypothetical protein
VSSTPSASNPTSSATSSTLSSPTSTSQSQTTLSSVTTTSQSQTTSQSSLSSSSAASSTTTTAPKPSHPATVGAYTFQGCYTEIPNGRALSEARHDDAQMTTEKCAASCSTFTYFAIEYGQECKFPRFHSICSY